MSGSTLRECVSSLLSFFNSGEEIKIFSPLFVEKWKTIFSLSSEEVLRSQHKNLRKLRTCTVIIHVKASSLHSSLSLVLPSSFLLFTNVRIFKCIYFLLVTPPFLSISFWCLFSCLLQISPFPVLLLLSFDPFSSEENLSIMRFLSLILLLLRHQIKKRWRTVGKKCNIRYGKASGRRGRWGKVVKKLKEENLSE